MSSAEVRLSRSSPKHIGSVDPYALKIPAPKGRNTSLQWNVTSPFHAEPGQKDNLDRILFWTTADLEAKLIDFQQYYNGHRTHEGLEGRLPEPPAGGPVSPTGLGSYRWRRHCRGLYQTPIAA